MTIKNKPYSLYLHVPFCASICSYCDFCHVIYREEIAQQWLEAIAYEIAQKDISEHLRTVYIGGGTPTSLSSFQLDCLLGLLDPFTSEVEEYTIEINPETLTEEKADIIASHGINRASVGLQTSNSHVLTLLGRHHSLDTIRDCLNLLKEKGIQNISLDLMYSLPTQTMDDLKISIQDAISLEPTHLSFYSLTIEDNTVFGKKGYQSLDEDTEADMYEYICQALPKYGFQQYEVSNFSLRGYDSKHNSAYWNYRDFYGIGCGASGKEGLCRYDNLRNIKDYIADPLQRNEIYLSEEDAMFEMLMMGIRFRNGMNLNLFEQTFGHTFEEIYGNKAQALIRDGMMQYLDGRIQCTAKGYEVMNSLLVEFM